MQHLTRLLSKETVTLFEAVQEFTVAEVDGDELLVVVRCMYFGKI
jgi:hypothetical protein